MENRIIKVLVAAMLCAAAFTGCSDSEDKQSENSEVLMIDADIQEDSVDEEEQQTTETTSETTAAGSTSVKSTTKTTTKTTAKTTAKTTKTSKKKGEGGTTQYIEDEYYEDDNYYDPEPVEPQTPETPQPTEAPVIPPEELTIVIGEDCTQYVKNVPYISLDEGISCMGEGYDRVYDYGDYILYTFADYAGTGDYVQEVDLVTPVYSTNAGIRVGSSRADVESVYGTSDSGKYASSEGGFLMFSYDENDLVNMVMYFVE